jgi:hypothetical protein
MGWASYLEDVIKRFDSNRNHSFVVRGGTSPSAAAKAERRRLDEEKKTNQTAIQVFQQNQKKLKKLNLKRHDLELQYETLLKQLSTLEHEIAAIGRNNSEVDGRLASYRNKFSKRIASFHSVEQSPESGSIELMVQRIDAIRKDKHVSLSQETRQTLDALAAYAQSEKRVKEQEFLVEGLNRKTHKAKVDLEALCTFRELVENQARALRGETQTYEGWEVMDAWLKNNPTITPKEERFVAEKGSNRQRESPVFNPVIDLLCE